MESENSLTELKARLREIADLRAAAAVLDWDQATYMPQGGGEARGRQTALLSRLAHERWISPEIGRLLDGLARFPAGGDRRATCEHGRHRGRGCDDVSHALLPLKFSLRLQMPERAAAV